MAYLADLQSDSCESPMLSQICKEFPPFIEFRVPRKGDRDKEKAGKSIEVVVMSSESREFMLILARFLFGSQMSRLDKLVS